MKLFNGLLGVTVMLGALVTSAAANSFDIPASCQNLNVSAAIFGDDFLPTLEKISADVLGDFPQQLKMFRENVANLKTKFSEDFVTPLRAS